MSKEVRQTVNNEQQTREPTANGPFFSIIVPVYNVAPYLRECLDSMLAQTFADWECLCVNDGSTDESDAILDEYALRDPRFRVFHKKNGGVSSARNLALDNAKGEWIGFLDGDDIYHFGLMERCNKAIIDFPLAEVVRFSEIWFNDGDVCLWSEVEDGMVKIDCQYELNKQCLEGGLCCRIYHANIAKCVQFKPLVLGEDLLWGIEVVSRANLLVDIGCQAYGYRVRLGSTMHSSMSLVKYNSLLDWRYNVWKVLKTSSKSVSMSYMRFVELALTEGFSEVYFKIPKTIRGSIWTRWRRVLKDITENGKGSWWIKFSTKLVTTINCQAFIWCLFYVPYWLKKRGIHR